LENARKSTEAALAAQSQAVSAARPDAYRMEIATLQARVKELEGQMEEDRNSSAKEVSTLAAQLALTRDTNRSLTEANRALMNAKQSEAPTVDKAEFDQLQGRVRDLTAGVAELTRQNDKLSADNEAMVAERAALRQQLDDARRVATTAPGLADEKAALQERLEAVGASLLKAQQDIDVLQKENADATSQALAARTAAEKAQAELAAMQGRTTDAEKASESHNAAVAELTEANSKLETERTELRRQLTAARAENARLAQTSGSLEQLKAEADRSAQQNIAALSAQLAQMQRDLQSARDTNSRIMEGNTVQERDRTAVINQLRAENTALAARLVQAQGTLDQIASAARLGTPAATIASGGSAPSRPVATSSAAENRIHSVAEGDSLSRISMRYYGTANRWQEIYNANRDVLQNSSTLRVGMQLRIP
jgi:nucleoid-associated protein YgaU